MAFKMKGKSPMMKALIGKQGNLPPELKAKIEAAPESATKMRKASPAKMKKDKILKNNPDADRRVLSEEDKKKAMKDKEVVSRGQTSSTSETRKFTSKLKKLKTARKKKKIECSRSLVQV